MKIKLTFVLLMLSLLVGLVGAQPAAAAANTWTALPNNGLNGRISTMAILGDYLYVGGEFTETADGSVKNLNHIARYNMKTKTWSAMDENGLDDRVNAMAILGNDLYVGGFFGNSMGGAVLNGIAKYDTLTNTLGSLSGEGFNSSVDSLAVYGNSTLFVGGGFTGMNNSSINANGIVKYRTDTNTWHEMPDNGLNGSVLSIHIDGNTLYAGGEFTESAGGATKNLNKIARYHLLGISWSSLPGNGLNGRVWDFAELGNKIVVGGEFTKTSNLATNLNYVAIYDPGANTWSALSNNILNNRVFALELNGDDLYVGGGFTTANYWSIAKYNTLTGAWSDLGSEGLSDWVLDMEIVNGELFVGGDFISERVFVSNLNKIAQYTIRKSVNVKSAGANDGWVLESGENTNVGGTMNATATTLRIGDDAAKKQYRSILSFDTSAIPDDAVITNVTLKFEVQGVVGAGDPVTIFQGFVADVRKGTFVTSTLQQSDWQSAANKTIGPLTAVVSGDWRSLNLTATKAQINPTGVTQIRLRFKLGDNNNAAANYLNIFSGNAALAHRPQLIVQYYIP